MNLWRLDMNEYNKQPILAYLIKLLMDEYFYASTN